MSADPDPALLAAALMFAGAAVAGSCRPQWSWHLQSGGPRLHSGRPVGANGLQRRALGGRRRRQ